MTAPVTRTTVVVALALVMAAGCQVPAGTVKAHEAQATVAKNLYRQAIRNIEHRRTLERERARDFHMGEVYKVAASQNGSVSSEYVRETIKLLIEDLDAADRLADAERAQALAHMAQYHDLGQEVARRLKDQGIPDEVVDVVVPTLADLLKEKPSDAPE